MMVEVLDGCLGVIMNVWNGARDAVIFSGVDGMLLVVWH